MRTGAAKAVTAGWAVALRLLCAFALLAVGFAHKLPEAVAAEATDFSAYVLPDGTLPVICVTDTGTDQQTDSHKTKHIAASDCEACRIAQGLVFAPPPPALSLPLRVQPTAVPVLKAEAFHRRLYPPNGGPRAPPAEPLTV